jgi:hypothetical protein
VAQPFDPNYRTYDFEIIREDWNEYELQDTTRIRSKLVVTKILRRQTTPPNQYEIVGMPVFVVTTDLQRRRPPNLLTPQESLLLNTPGPSEIKIPVEVATSAERWNQYRITQTDEVLRVKLVLIDAYRLRDHYDETGEPMYWITTGNIIAPIPPRDENRRLIP